MKHLTELWILCAIMVIEISKQIITLLSVSYLKLEFLDFEFLDFECLCICASVWSMQEFSVLNHITISKNLKE